MAIYTSHYKLIKPAGSDGFDIAHANENADKVEAALIDNSKAFTTTGTGTAILVSIPSLSAYRTGFLFHIIASANNNSAATTININGLGSKSAYKPGTTTAPNIVAGKSYTFFDNGTSFFLQASAGGGTATAEDVLAGETFSSDLDSEIEGTMPNIGTMVIYPSNVDQTIPLGKHDGNGYVVGEPNLIESKIKSGEQVYGIIGTCGEVIYDFNFGLPPF